MVREEFAAAVVEVLRDGFGATPERLRYTSFDDDGPVDCLYGVMGALLSVPPDRPTHRDVPERCTGWVDFAQRLEWVLTTLPWGATLVLSIPGPSTGESFVQFHNQFEIANQAVI